MPGPTHIDTCATHLQFLPNSLTILPVRASCLDTGHRAFLQPGPSNTLTKSIHCLHIFPKQWRKSSFIARCTAQPLSYAELKWMYAREGNEGTHSASSLHLSKLPALKKRTIQLVYMGCSQNYGLLLVIDYFTAPNI